MPSHRTLICLLILLAFPVAASAQQDDLLEKLDEALTDAASFEQGQASDTLVAIEKFVFSLPIDSPLQTGVEQCLTTALTTAKTADAKRFLCRQLRVVGTAKCVPAVANLLTDKEVTHMAIYCLGRMEGDEAGKALHDALGKTTGDVQVGILNALADRRQAGIADDCVKLLRSENLTVAKAAARALGRLGLYDFVKPLREARAAAPESLQTEINNALLCIAEQLVAKGDERAEEVYEELAAESFSEPFRFAALRGLVQSGRPEAAKRLLQAIKSENRKLRHYAISLMSQIPGSAATAMFAAALTTLDSEDQVILLRALGARGDTTAASAVSNAAKSDQEAVRVAAIEALGTAGTAGSLATLLDAAAGDAQLPQQLARASLVKLEGEGIDAKLIDLASSGEASARAEAIRALAGRGVTGASPALLSAAQDSDGSVRSAAIEALGVLAATQQLPAMVALAAKPTGAEDKANLVAAIGKLFYRIDDAAARSAPVLEAYDSAPASAQVTLLAILSKSGSVPALAKVRAAVKSSDPVLRDAAIAALADWPNADAIEPLLEFVGATSDARLKEIALKGYIRLAEDTPDPTKTYLRVLQYVSTVNDRKRVLEGLGQNAGSTEALNLALKYVDNKALQAAAGLAALRIAHRLRGSHEQLAREALHVVVDKVEHQDVRMRAQEVLNDLDKYEDHILQWLAVGPFTEKGKDGQAIFNTVFPPELPDAGDIEWKPITKGIGSWDINLEATFGGMDYCAAYVRTRVWSPKAQNALLEMGSDDALRVWLNGRLVHENWKMSGAAPRQEKVLVDLVEGWNELKMKVVDEAGGWVFAARLRKPDGTKLEGLKYEAK